MAGDAAAFLGAVTVVGVFISRKTPAFRERNSNLCLCIPGHTRCWNMAFIGAIFSRRS